MVRGLVVDFVFFRAWGRQSCWVAGCCVFFGHGEGKWEQSHAVAEPKFQYWTDFGLGATSQRRQKSFKF